MVATKRGFQHALRDLKCDVERSVTHTDKRHRQRLLLAAIWGLLYVVLVFGTALTAAGSALTSFTSNDKTMAGILAILALPFSTANNYFDFPSAQNNLRRWSYTLEGQGDDLRKLVAEITYQQAAEEERVDSVGLPPKVQSLGEAIPILNDRYYKIIARITAIDTQYSRYSMLRHAPANTGASQGHDAASTEQPPAARG
jgi:hypothetical protein